MLSYSNDLDTIPNEENLLTLYLKDQSTINAPLLEDLTHRSRLLLDKYEEMRELSGKVIQAREFLTVAEKSLYSNNRAVESFKARWAPDTQKDIQERTRVFKQFYKTTHQISKRAGSYKRRLDHEIKLVNSDQGI